MFKIRSLAARRVLAGGLAAAALTTGVGLAGAGIAHAETNGIYTCIDNVRGTTTITDHGHSSTLPLGLRNRDAHCTAKDGTQPIGGFFVGEALVPDGKAGSSTEGKARGYIHAFNSATGAVSVGLGGQILNGPSYPRSETPGGHNSVELTNLKPGKGYVMREITRDNAGRTIDTTMVFDLVS